MPDRWISAAKVPVIAVRSGQAAGTPVPSMALVRADTRVMSATVVRQVVRQRPAIHVLPAAVQRAQAVVAVIVVESTGDDDDTPKTA